MHPGGAHLRERDAPAAPPERPRLRGRGDARAESGLGDFGAATIVIDFSRRQKRAREEEAERKRCKGIEWEVDGEADRQIERRSRRE